MSSTSRRRERTITVETGELGPVRVRRISLGGMARIAERLRAEGVHDEAALGEALVAEVVVSSLDEEGGSETAPRAADPFDTARLALLSEDDRRSIAAAVLTLEGVKAAGEGVLEDPRRTLARRYSHVLDTQRHAPGEGAQRAAQPEDAAREAAPAPSPTEVPQFALFEGLAPPLSPAAAGTGSGSGPGEGARAAPSARAPGALERERARLEADVADLEALLARQAEQREALEAGAAAAVDRERGAIQSARRYRWLAAALLALLVVGVGAQFAWIGMLRRDAAQQRVQFDSELRAQRQALEQAQRAAAEASARVQQLEARRGAAPSAAKSAGARSATARPTAGKAASAASPAATRTARPAASTSKASASKSPAEPNRKP